MRAFLALSLIAGLALRDEELDKRRDKVATTLQEIRGLKFSSGVPTRLGSRKEYGANALDNAKLLYGSDLPAAERALKALGLIGGRLRLELAIPALACAGKVQAFYRKGELVVVDPAVPDDELLYKLSLALSDQHHPYAEAAAKLGASLDAQLALACVHHGDADACKQLFWAGKKASDRLDDDHLKKLAELADTWEREDSKWASAVAPRLFVRASDFIWRRGGIFVETIRSAGGMEAVDKLYEKPPASTEQVLHPGKYGKDEPVAVGTKPLEEALAEKKWKVVYRTTLGELGAAAVLETHLKEGIEKASPGWGGDTLVYLEPAAGGPGLAVWATQWDSVDDAVEFQAAAQRISAALNPADKELGNLVVRRGRSVAFIVSLPRPLQDAVLDALWKCTAGSEPFGKE